MKEKLQTLFVKAQPYSKALSAFVALLIPFVTVLVTFLSHSTHDFNDTLSLVAAAGALIGGTGGVYQVTNTPAVPEGK